MMNGYVFSMTTALAVFPMLALVISLPFALYQYHKYGSIPWLRVLIFFTFVYYLLTVYFLIILPLPDKNDTSLFGYANHVELIPFNNITEYFSKHAFTWDMNSIMAFVKSANFYELAFNVLMIVPFGIYLRYYFKCSFKKTVILSFLLSLFFELTQLSGLYGYYPAPYRTFDTDDLICNTLGGLIGWVISPALTFFLPKRKDLDAESIASSKDVTIIRRLSADAVDAIIFAVIVLGIQLVLIMNKCSWQFEKPVEYGMFFAIQWVYAVCSNGMSPGKAICRLRVCDGNGHKASIGAITVRYLVLWGMIDGIGLLSSLSDILETQASGMTLHLLSVLGMVCIAAELLILFDFLRSLFKDIPFFYERISHTEVGSTMPS